MIPERYQESDCPFCRSGGNKEDTGHLLIECAAWNEERAELWARLEELVGEERWNYLRSAPPMELTRFLLGGTVSLEQLGPDQLDGSACQVRGAVIRFLGKVSSRRYRALRQMYRQMRQAQRQGDGQRGTHPQSEQKDAQPFYPCLVGRREAQSVLEVLAALEVPRHGGVLEPGRGEEVVATSGAPPGAPERSSGRGRRARASRGRQLVFDPGGGLCRR